MSLNFSLSFLEGYSLRRINISWLRFIFFIFLSQHEMHAVNASSVLSEANSPGQEASISILGRGRALM